MKNLEQGERLVETFIAENMWVSWTLVTEALRKLEFEGWAKNIQGNGLLLREYQKNIIEIYEMREALDGLEFRLECS